MTLVEVISSIGVFSLAILIAAGGIISLSRKMQVTYQAGLVANLAMVIGQYRATDMLRNSAANYAANRDVTAFLTGATTYSNGHYAYWNSLSRLNWDDALTNTKGAQFHGYRFSSSSPSQPTNSGAVGTTWVDQCPLFDAITNVDFNNSTGYPWGYWPASGTAALAACYYSKTDRVMVGKSGSTFIFKGGTSSDRAVWRLHRLNATFPAIASALYMSDYSNIWVGFTEPSMPSGNDAIGIKGHFTVATFWLITRTLDFRYNQSGYYNLPTAATPATFLGRYLMLDSLEP